MMNKMGHRGYIASRAVNGNQVPHHVQNLVVRDYADRNGLRYLLSATEMSPENCFIVLNDVLSGLDKISGIIMYSLFMLPKRSDTRADIYNLLLKNRKTLHAAVENISLNNEKDIQRLEEIFSLATVLDDCLSAKEMNAWMN